MVGIPPRLVLASGSPRRAGLLARVGVAAEVRAAEIDETPRPGESAAAMVTRLAAAKAAHVAGGLSIEGGPWLVLAGDTTVLVNGEILGKPSNEDDAERMLMALSDRCHQVVGGLATIDHSGRTESAVDVTTVWFRALSGADISWYLGTGEADGKAGAYGIQGAASVFVERIEGNYDNVVGLPLATADRLLRAHGHALWSFARRSS